MSPRFSPSSATPGALSSSLTQISWWERALRIRSTTVRTLLSGSDWTVLSCYVIRQPPHGTLPWHFDNQAIHLAECRVLIPLHARPAAR